MSSEAGTDRPTTTRGARALKNPFVRIVVAFLYQEPWRWSKADRKVAQTMSRYWTNLARSGDPNGNGLPSWPAFTSTDSRVLSFGDPIKVADVANISSLTVLDAV
jgi:para-nitrobenzyl esterase